MSFVSHKRVHQCQFFAAKFGAIRFEIFRQTRKQLKLDPNSNTGSGKGYDDKVYTVGTLLSAST